MLYLKLPFKLSIIIVFNGNTFYRISIFVANVGNIFPQVVFIVKPNRVKIYVFVFNISRTSAIYAMPLWPALLFFHFIFKPLKHLMVTLTISASDNNADAKFYDSLKLRGTKKKNQLVQHNNMVSWSLTHSDDISKISLGGIHIIFNDQNTDKCCK